MDYNWWGYDENSVYELPITLALVFGNINPDQDLVGSAALTANDAHQIDRKLDNGIPNSGYILADHGYNVGSNNQ